MARSQIPGASLPPNPPVSPRGRRYSVRSTTLAPAACFCHRGDAVLGAGFGLISLAGRGDVAIAGLEPEPELAALVLGDFELPRRWVSSAVAPPENKSAD